VWIGKAAIANRLPAHLYHLRDIVFFVGLRLQLPYAVGGTDFASIEPQVSREAVRKV
jgi:hypothetical protein